MKTISRNLPPAVCLFALGLGLANAPAAEIRKANNGFPLDDGLSWIGGIAPTNTDVAVWDADSNVAPSSPFLDLHWQGIRMLENPFLGNVTIPGGPYTLTLGDAGIDMSAAGGNLEFYCGFVSLDANQVWNIGPGRMVTVLPANGSGTGALHKTGAGTLKLYYSTAASHLSDSAALGLAGGTVQLEGAAYTEAVGSAQVYGDATRVMSSGQNLLLNNITRSPGGTVDFTQAGIALTSTPNDASENGGMLDGGATVNGQYWAQVTGVGVNKPIDAYPTYFIVTFFETNNVNLPGFSAVITNNASLAINSLRFEFDTTLVVGTNGAFSLTNLTGGILMSGNSIQAAIVSASPGRVLRGPPGRDLIFHVPYLFQTLSNQVVIADNAGCGLTKAGAGTLLLNQGANNSYAGLTTINGGTLQTGNFPGRRYVSTALRINHDGTYLHGAGDNNLTFTTINMNGGVLNLFGASDSCPALSLDYNGLITGYNPLKTFTVGNASTSLDARWGQIDVRLSAPGGLIKTTDRKVALARNSTLTATTWIENGALQITGNATVDAGNLIIGTTTNNAKLILGGTNGFGNDLSGAIIITNLAVLNPGPLIGAAIVGGSSLFNDNKLILNFAHNTNFDLTLLGGNGPYESSISLVKTGAMVLTLTNGSPFAGPIRIEAGTVKLSAPYNVQGRSLDLAGGALDLNGFSPALASLNGFGSVTNTGASAATLTLSNANFSGVIADGVNSVAVLATYSIVGLYGNNTYSGGTVITNGGISVSDISTIGSGTLTLGGGTFNITAHRTAPLPNAIELAADTYIENTGIQALVAAEFSSSVDGGAGTLRFINDSYNVTNLFEPRFSGNFTFHRPIVIMDHALVGGLYGKTRFVSGNTNGTTQIYNGAISGDGSFRRSVDGELGGVTLLTVSNSYSGATLVDNGTLLVNGSLATNTVTVTNRGTLGGNGTIRGPVLVQNGGTLAAGMSVGRLVISNALAFAGGSTNRVEVDKNFGTNDLVRGLTSVTYGGTLVVDVLTGTLGTNDNLKLFEATTYGGAFTNIIPAAPGAGLAWNTSSLVTNGTLKVTTAPNPQFTSALLSGTNLVASGSGGNANGNYHVLTATNITLPVSNWISLATNSFDGGGNFIFSNGVSPGVPQRFFLIRLP